MASKKMSDDDVVAQLFQKRPEKSGSDQAMDPLGHCILPRVNIDQIIPYEDNPRTSENTRYDEIKASIRAVGLQDKFTLTKQSPDDDVFIIRKGGNTRLNILKELWEETGEERFYWLENIEYFPFTNDIDLLAGHISENENRGNLKFIEKAQAAAKLKAKFEEREGNELKHKELALLFKNAGWPVDATILGQYFYCLEHMAPVLITLLWDYGGGRPVVQKIRYYHRYYLKYCKAQGIKEEEFKALLSNALEAVAHFEIFDADAERDFEYALGKAVGEVLGLSPERVNDESKAFELGAEGSSSDPGQQSPIEDPNKQLSDDHVPETVTESQQPTDLNEPAGDAQATESPHQHEGQSEMLSSPALLEPEPLDPQPENAIAARQAPDSVNSVPADSQTALPTDPEEAKAALSELWELNRKLAQRIVNQLDAKIDVVPVEFGMGFLLSDMIRHLDDRHAAYSSTIQCLIRIAAVSTASAELEFLLHRKAGREMPPQYTLLIEYKPQTIFKLYHANYKSDELITMFTLSAARLAFERGKHRLGQSVNEVNTRLIDEKLVTLENNYNQVIDLWSAMGWEL